MNLTKDPQLLYSHSHNFLGFKKSSYQIQSFGPGVILDLDDAGLGVLHRLLRKRDQPEREVVGKSVQRPARVVPKNKKRSLMRCPHWLRSFEYSRKSAEPR